MSQPWGASTRVTDLACDAQDIEANLAKKDAERDRIKERHDQPGAVAKDIELNDPAMVSRRRRMMLPAPQISEAELQAIARGDTNMDLDPELTEGAGGEATRRLLGDYQTPGRLLHFEIL